MNEYIHIIHQVHMCIIYIARYAVRQVQPGRFKGTQKINYKKIFKKRRRRSGGGNKNIFAYNKHNIKTVNVCGIESGLQGGSKDATTFYIYSKKFMMRMKCKWSNFYFEWQWMSGVAPPVILPGRPACGKDILLSAERVTGDCLMRGWLKVVTFPRYDSNFRTKKDCNEGMSLRYVWWRKLGQGAIAMASGLF